MIPLGVHSLDKITYNVKTTGILPPKGETAGKEVCQPQAKELFLYDVITLYKPSKYTRKILMGNTCAAADVGLSVCKAQGDNFL